MEIISGLNQKDRCLMDIEAHLYLQDHHIDGKAVMPAVESVIIMARAAQTVYPQIPMDLLRKAIFARFLPLESDKPNRQIFVDLEKTADGSIKAYLMTFLKSKTGRVSRDILHAYVEFAAEGGRKAASSPFRHVSRLEGECISIPSATIYRELVTFGEAYQNIIGDLAVSSHGALAYVSGGGHEADEQWLGSPFPLDAAMHAACVWGQRFAGIVGFPVGWEERFICRKTQKGKDYLARVAPLTVAGDEITFNAWIYDANESLCEVVNGIRMKDVLRGRLRPPEWIKAEGQR
ncbi:MAG TPA: polyketide synthase dehydratase domain-containing protein [Smithella sp.]|nr:polyketide synthase dehydratase domain-containing protein [Smithella sp.]